MLSLFKKKKQSVIGVDLSSKSIKLLQLSENNGQWTVIAYGSTLLSTDAMEGSLIAKHEAVSSTIKTLLSKSGFTAKKAVMAIPDAVVISKVIQINDNLDESEMEELVILEADKHISYSIDEINLDFDVLGPSAKNSAMLDVLMVVTRANNVTARVETINDAGLSVAVVDVESFAMERAALLIKDQLPEQGVDKTVVILDIGASSSHLFVLHNMKVIFTRDEEFGGQLLVQSLSQHAKISIEESYHSVITGQVPKDYESAVLHPFIDAILLQIKRTLQFFYSTTQLTTIDHIVLSGGVSRTLYLADRINEKLNIPVSIANPFQHMQFERNVSAILMNIDGPSWMMACGLAMREVV